MAEAELKKSISFSVLVLLAINAIIGTGIFFVPGIAAKIAGPASLISWIGVAIIALGVAACFSELVGMFPKAGGVYEYTKQAFGEFGGFIVGWTSWLVANVTIAMLAIGSLEYLSVFIPMSSITKIIVALMAVFFINLISLRGIDLSVKVLLIFSIITIMSLWTLISWGVYYVDISNISFLSIFPKVSIIVAMVYILETFFGWETVANLAEETKDPERVVPKVMMIGTVIVTLLAIGIVTVSLGAVNWRILAGSASPLNDVAKIVMGSVGAKIMTILIFLNIFGGSAAWIITTPRLIFALGRDGVLPKILGKVHPKYRTPYVAIGAQAVLSSLIILSGSYKLLLELVLPLAIFMYAMVVASVTILRFTKPNVPRAFKVPFGKVLPVILSLVLVFLAGGIDALTTITAGMFVFLGVPLYLLAGISTKPEIAKKMLSWTGGLQKFTYKFTNKKHHKYILNYFSRLKNGRLLNLSCGIGELSKDLAILVGPRGHVDATDVSSTNLKRANKTAQNEGLTNIHFGLEDSVNRHNIHPHIQRLHGVTSIGILGYVGNPDYLLHEINIRSNMNGLIYFIDYDRIFKFLRANKWLRTDDGIYRKFARYGFRVQVKRKKGIFWDTIHIYGWKVQDSKRAPPKIPEAPPKTSAPAPTKSTSYPKHLSK